VVSQLRQELRLRVFEKRVTKGIFASKRKEVKGVWRKLHNKVLCDLQFSLSMIRMSKSQNMS
jgi:hypothetical protein